MTQKIKICRRQLKLEPGLLSIRYTEQGNGARIFLLLHAGVGPASMSGLGAALAKHARVILPTHPGFEGEPRPEFLNSVAGLARAYVALLDELDIFNVVLVGSSFGGWTAAEMALLNSPRIVGLIPIDAAGIAVDPAEAEVINPRSFPPRERLALSFHQPVRFANLSISPSALARIAAHDETIRGYNATPFMHHPTLRQRVGEIRVPTLVIWGESDRILSPAYGRLYAACIPGARFELVRAAGHFPQIEQLKQTEELIIAFAESKVPSTPLRKCHPGL